MERGGRTHPTSSSALRRDTPLFLLRLYTMAPQYASLFYPLVLSYWYYRIKGIFVNSATWFVCRLVQFCKEIYWYLFAECFYRILKFCDKMLDIALWHTKAFQQVCYKYYIVCNTLKCNATNTGLDF